MTERDKELARQAGFVLFDDYTDGLKKTIELFAAAIRAEEREACALICDDKHHTWRWDDEPDSASGPRDCAAAIRARGNT